MITNISGFPEFLPNEQLIFERIVKIIRNEFELYNFLPLDTSAIERNSTLLAKGNDNEIYGIYRLADKDGMSSKELGMRFDLTVPLARYVSQNYGQLIFPYRRYHIAPVWRGERPQAGRYRQFYQADIDVIGDGKLDEMHDAEIISIMCRIFTKIGINNFTVKINDRGLLSIILKHFGIIDNYMLEAIRIVDKMEKISSEEFSKQLSLVGMSVEGINIINSWRDKDLSNKEWFVYLGELIKDNEELNEKLLSIARLISDSIKFGAKEENINIDPKLARGLTYYTGIVCETTLGDYPKIGSICSGGRYDNLADNFTNKKLPGVGMSIGLSRLVHTLIEEGFFLPQGTTIAKVMVSTQNRALMERYISIAADLRQAGISTELYLINKPLGQQLKYASKKGFRYCIIADDLEFDRNIVILRNLDEGTQQNLSMIDLIEILKASI
ncbi:MAG: histidine--tRNA ligase [Rickettsiaceae bacterium]|nr:histidine--tRNA ligase [Rickettsiaceae bacterium]